jgi:hypothetical protein
MHYGTIIVQIWKHLQLSLHLFFWQNNHVWLRKAILYFMQAALTSCAHYVSPGDEFSFGVWGHKALTIWLALCGQATAAINNGRFKKKAEEHLMGDGEMHTSQLTSKSQITRRDCWAGRLAWDTREERKSTLRYEPWSCLCAWYSNYTCAHTWLLCCACFW